MSASSQSSSFQNTHHFFCSFVGATKHLYNWLYPLVGRSVTQSFDNPHVAPYWPTWPCSFRVGCGFRVRDRVRVGIRARGGLGFMYYSPK